MNNFQPTDSQIPSQATNIYKTTTKSSNRIRRWKWFFISFTIFLLPLLLPLCFQIFNSLFSVFFPLASSSNLIRNHCRYEWQVYILECLLLYIYFFCLSSSFSRLSYFYANYKAVLFWNKIIPLSFIPFWAVHKWRTYLLILLAIQINCDQ